MDAAPGPARRGEVRILVVEDHVDTLAVTVRVLTRLGYHATPASTCIAALQLARHAHFDVLITDLALPDGTGWALFAQLQRLNPAVVGVAVTGHGMTYHLEESKSAGFRAHLTKPVDFKTLADTLDRCIDQATVG